MRLIAVALLVFVPSTSIGAADASRDRDELSFVSVALLPGIDDTLSTFRKSEPYPVKRWPRERSQDAADALEMLEPLGGRPQGPDDLGTIFEKELLVPGVDWGAVFDGSIEINDSSNFIPASIVKVATAALALETLGAGHRFETRLEWQQSASGIASSTEIFGTGDPTFGLADFESQGESRVRDLAMAMSARGVRELRGPVILRGIDWRWESPPHAPGVEARDHMQCYGALSQAFNFAANCAGLQIRAPNSAYWLDTAIDFPVDLMITKGDNTDLQIGPRRTPDGKIIAYVVRGTWARNRKSAVGIRVPVPNPKIWFLNLFRKELKRAGISHKPDAAPIASARTEKASTLSLPLAEILIPVLKHSDNFLADTLFKRAALTQTGHIARPLRDMAQFTLANAISRWMAEAGKPSFAGDLLLLDGAGLSRDNRSTPRAMNALLRALAAKPYFPFLWRALAVAGVDGTLANRLQGDATRGIVRAKTGTVRGAYQLIGFVPRYSPTGTIDMYVPFALLTSTEKRFESRVRTLHERALTRAVLDINPRFPGKHGFGLYQASPESIETE